MGIVNLQNAEIISELEKLKDEYNLLKGSNGTINKIYRRKTRYPTPILEKIQDKQEDIEKELKNKALAQDIKLKKDTLDRLFWFLAIETAVVFVLAFLQGWSKDSFYLEEWSFRLLLSSTILQITVMLLVAVKHLFPKK